MTWFTGDQIAKLSIYKDDFSLKVLVVVVVVHLVHSVYAWGGEAGWNTNLLQIIEYRWTCHYLHSFSWPSFIAVVMCLFDECAEQNRNDAITHSLWLCGFRLFLPRELVLINDVVQYLHIFCVSLVFRDLVQWHTQNLKLSQSQSWV